MNLVIENTGDGMECVDFRSLTRILYEKIGSSAYQTLEALASYIAEETLAHLSVTAPKLAPLATVRVSKPSAIVFASSSEVEISRTSTDYPRPSVVEDGGLHTATLALGSNLGDRFYNIELALRLLEAPNPETVLHVVDTSFMYETAPMYVTDQPAFINCACMIETNLAPSELLNLLKVIESKVGRVPSIRNGPRAVDLDIVFYDGSIIDTRSAPRKELDDLEGELVVPHPRLAEREFVLRPLNDMIPDFIHPQLRRSVSTLLAALPAAGMHKVIPFPQIPFESGPDTLGVPPTQTYWKFTSSNKPAARAGIQTLVMATLNATPDSFSDGAVHNTLPTALQYANDSVAAGASILDVGGYSTRPGAAFVSTEEEIARVAPCITAIRKAHTSLPISVDTFRPEVARAAISVGANCINDVYAFTGHNSYPSPTGDASDRCMEDMKSLAREFAVPVVLMHSRGEASSNKDYAAYEYAGANQQVVEGVRIELGEKVDRIVRGRGGVRRWLVIVDPGVGFSKSVDGNLEVLRAASSITADLFVGSGLDNRRRNALAGYPQLIGASRKSFLGIILENGGRKTEPKDRGWATAAAVACAVQQGALVVRVHDTREMLDVVQVANALW
ncbi:Dihydropteroate synthase [Roridomyces roridus]|uniref:Dihydropteroate synthase n=1 Tax=Roridomyces roridus TaxID=1738132 RepID=A0AAD7BRA0_9AGAR|nr:Dihydropteroate synthase [Roridomyces roridus]